MRTIKQLLLFAKYTILFDKEFRVTHMHQDKNGKWVVNLSRKNNKEPKYLNGKPHKHILVALASALYSRPLGEIGKHR